MVAEIECGKSFRCWECTKNCTMKEIFRLPEPLFMATLNETSKAIAGMQLASGVPYEEVEKERKLMVVTLVTSRKKYLEEKQKTS